MASRATWDRALPGVETLAVVDAAEAWVLHVLPDDTGKSAVFCAQRVPDGHAACVANMFIVRDVDLDDALGARRNFMLSENAISIAERCGLYDSAAAASSPNRLGATFDFTRIFSAGEARHRFYSGRRQWRALSLFAPDLGGLDPWYEDLPDYPFSVAVGPKVVPHMSYRFFCRVMRDTYAGTPFDLSVQPAAGPFGMTDRYDSANGCKAPRRSREEDGAFERPIGTFRMAYSYVGSPLACSPRAATKTTNSASSTDYDDDNHHMLYFAPHVSQTAVYLPVLVSPPPSNSNETDAVPAVLRCATIKKMDRASAYWAFRVVKHTARGLPWNRCLALIQNRQQAAENAVDVAQAKLLEDTVQRGDGVGDIAVAAARAELDKLNKRIVADWWELNDELLVRFGDGWEYDWTDDGTSLNRAVPA